MFHIQLVAVWQVYSRSHRCTYNKCSLEKIQHSHANWLKEFFITECVRQWCGSIWFIEDTTKPHKMLERKYFHTRTRILKNQTMVWGYLVTWSALRSLGLLSGYLVCSPGQFSGSSFMHSLWQFTPQFEHWKPCKENRI